MKVQILAEEVESVEDLETDAGGCWNQVEGQFEDNENMAFRIKEGGTKQVPWTLLWAQWLHVNRLYWEKH